MKRRFFLVATAIFIGFFSAVALCLRALNAQAVSSFSDGSMRVVVDAGHGGIDVGVSGVRTGVKESDLNLSISLLLKEELEDKGFEVILTRKTEGGLYDTTARGFKKRDMLRRKEIIEEADPAMIISVHQNFYSAGSIRGPQVFYAKETAGSEALAEGMQARLNDAYERQKVKPRKKMRAEYFMLTCYPCPAVIVECGFLSSPEDEALLTEKSWQKKLAETIAAGALDFVAAQTA